MIAPRIALMLFLAGASAGAQCAGPADPEACTHDALHGTHSETSAPSGSTFPDAHRQIRNYLDSAFGPFAVMRAAIGAGIDQSKPAPSEWDSPRRMIAALS